MADYPVPSTSITILFPQTIVGEIVVKNYVLGAGATAAVTTVSNVLQNLVIIEKAIPRALATVLFISPPADLDIRGGALNSTTATITFEGSQTGAFHQIIYGSANCQATFLSSSPQILVDAPLVQTPEFDANTDGDFWADYVPSRVALEPFLSTTLVSAKAEIRSLHKLMLLKDVVLNIYSLWGYDGLTQTSQISIGRDRIVQYCNTAMQMIYSHADRLDYFNRTPLEVTVDSTGKTVLPQTVQRLQGPVKLGSRSLQALASRVEADQFASWYLDSNSQTLPIAYFAEMQRLFERDCVEITLHVLPVPADNITVTVDVTMEPQRFDDADVLKGTILELPHLWVESLFLPIVRKLAAGDNLMNKAKLVSVSAEINSQYESARQMLGLADSAPPAIQRNREEAIPA